MEQKDTKKIVFRAINQYVTSNIVDSTEKDSKKGFVSWGSSNNYPEYLDDLYKHVATLKSIIEGTTDYVCGNGIEIDDILWNTQVNEKGETIEDLCRNISRDILKYGGFAVNVVRNKVGGVCGLYYIPLARLRADEKQQTFYYCKDWQKTSVGRVKFTVYPKFDPNGTEPNSIYFYSNNQTDVYPSPVWGAAVTACEIEKTVNQYHLNGIKNGFSADYYICMNNGVPSEEQADEIEEDILEKFSGENNAGRIVINFADDKEHATELTKLDTNDVGERYQSLITRTKSEIFASFRANPNLFGIPTENLGFNQEEYESSFKLYNRTVVRPIQQILVKSFNKILGKNITIIPFSIDDENKEKDVTE